MAVAYRGAGAAAQANSATLDVEIPASTQAGDLLILPWALNNAVGRAGIPSGWTLGAESNGGSCLLAVLYRYAPSAGPGTVTVASASTTRNVARCAAYSGAVWVDAVIEGVGSNPNESVPTPANPIAAAASEISIAACRGGLTGSPSLNPPGTLTKRFDASSGAVSGGSILGLGDRLTPLSAGSLGPRTWTASQSIANVIGATIEVRASAPVSPWSYWDGSTVSPLVLEGLWDGTDLVPVTPALVP